MEVSTMLADIRGSAKLTQERLAQVLGVSFVSVNRWERGASTPSPAQMRKIAELHRATHDLWSASKLLANTPVAFRSRGVRSGSKRKTLTRPTLFDEAPAPVTVTFAHHEHPPILQRITNGQYFGCVDEAAIDRMLDEHQGGARIRNEPPANGMSAGKNTYTYDAHTYHTKVPPQGIAELLKHYLPEGGLVLDPFAGSGMTGVASRVLGYDCILSELSPAACFIANRFVSKVNARAFEVAVASVLDEVDDLRSQLYTTTCRECGRATEILYTVWSYRVLCIACSHEFVLWDYCRSYGKKVREHKILTEFPCPACHTILKKSRLKRTIAEPVQLGYMCCGSRQQEVTHPLNQSDLEILYRLQVAPPIAEGYFPAVALPEGVNLRQPKHHGLDRVDKLYTPRNLAAMSHLWKQIHRIDDPELAAHVAFVFTSLYQRVTR
ncbi:MAG: DNA methyltransferase, partial [Ktedonobacterales bacterium]